MSSTAVGFDPAKHDRGSNGRFTNMPHDCPDPVNVTSTAPGSDDAPRKRCSRCGTCQPGSGWTVCGSVRLCHACARTRTDRDVQEWAGDRDGYDMVTGADGNTVWACPPIVREAGDPGWQDCVGEADELGRAACSGQIEQVLEAWLRMKTMGWVRLHEPGVVLVSAADERGDEAMLKRGEELLDEASRRRQMAGDGPGW